MNNLPQAVNLVDKNVKKLIEKCTFLKEENQLLYRKLAEVENKVVLEQQLNNKLTEEYNLLKVAKTIEGSRKDKRETKLKINALIRQIDACIAQLNERVL